ncbi:putative bifunctional dTTP/UTP pyrophosphatase/methyltransferase protein [Tenrec ecaudatus]|uniref:putative bifunctional dTTP/UTP pyrophosphatase/methyltransferase protein n=1 Tax=Tenrec ecaudatus TaxID=94439 RepID=UPI003F5A6061
MVLCPVIRKLLHKRVVLASASPRRREILSQAGLRFEVVPSRFKEKLDKASFPTPFAYAIETAKQKALDVASRMHLDSRTPDLVIGADTIVTVGGLILEKPVDKQDAYHMLSRLSGKEHSVFTGVAIVQCSIAGSRLETSVVEFHEETRVQFSELSEEMLWEYIHSGEPMDKAGGYGIQALGGMLVESVHGDFLNVVGFPLNHFCKQLSRLYCPEALRGVKRDPLLPAEPWDASRKNDTWPGPACNGAVDAPPPFPWELLSLMEGFQGSQVLFTACRLAVFNVLKDGALLSAAEVAGRIDASLSGTEWLLAACADLGLLERREEGYCNTESASLYLVSGARHALGSLVRLCDSHSRDFSDLEAAIRQGGALLQRVTGRRPEDAWKGPDLHSGGDGVRLRVLGARHELAGLSAHAVATAFDLSGFSAACHLGGGTGALALGLAREYPHLQVTVFDHPDNVRLAAEERFRPAEPQAARIRFVAGDLFKDPLPEADLFVLSSLLQDWPEDRVRALLGRLSQHCRQGCGLLVATTLAEEERPAHRSWRDAVGLRPWGSGRSAGHYKRLLQAHGFSEVRIARTGALLDAVLAAR